MNTTDPNHSDHLWDGSGPPDDFTRNLEQTLRSLAHHPDTAPSFLGAPPAVASPSVALRIRQWAPLAAAAVLVVGAIVWWRWPSRPSGGWTIESVAGVPRVNSRIVTANDTLPAKTWLVTDATSSATVKVSTIGTLTVAPGTRVRIQETGASKHEVELAHGTISAFITAPPRLFFLKSPSALTTDMGCRYDLTTDERGNGKLTVTLGWVIVDGVASAGNTHPWQAWTPRGYVCPMSESSGPGTPYLAGASQTLVRSLHAMDTKGWETASPSELRETLDLCESGDAVTLWHLLWRVNESNRATVLDRLEAVQWIKKFDRDRVLKLESQTMDKLWRFLAGME